MDIEFLLKVTQLSDLDKVTLDLIQKKQKKINLFLKFIKNINA